MLIYGEEDSPLRDSLMADEPNADVEFDDEEIEEMIDAVVIFYSEESLTDKAKEAVEETLAQLDEELAAEMMINRIASANGYGWFKKTSA